MPKRPLKVRSARARSPDPRPLEEDVPLRLPRQGARPRLLFILATLAVAGLAFLPAITGSTRAKPPSTPFEVPAGAFGPVVLPSDADVTAPRISGPARLPDDGLPDRPSAPTTRFSGRHPGIDIAAPAGTPVRAIAGGTVTWAGWKTNGSGDVVEIRHSDGMVSTYKDNRAVADSVGQVVAAGERIAGVGATGWATGPHLDLRIEMGGRLVDPLGSY